MLSTIVHIFERERDTESKGSRYPRFAQQMHPHIDLPINSKGRSHGQAHSKREHLAYFASEQEKSRGSTHRICPCEHHGTHPRGSERELHLIATGRTTNLCIYLSIAMYLFPRHLPPPSIISCMMEGWERIKPKCTLSCEGSLHTIQSFSHNQCHSRDWLRVPFSFFFFFTLQNERET